ncbi:hypothetical protein [Magnetospirillum sp. UT-4]|uniref:hypothetical protein n=1 Tax=Magnetospirillum sp. UT-4 TaxID=2681467 RepID=UPI0013815370|nr:hypothetical protein [Magnetospirillum sp. UT-4]CAA7613201.1 conserved hypothetical protein [Magnetospirillum sp. UT-4]
MLTLTLPRDLDDRLAAAARRLGRSPEDCALSAIRAFVADCEEATRTAQRLGGDPVVRPPEDFWE